MNGHRRNALYGLLGFLVPTLITLASYPVLVFYLGAEVVGIYMLATMLSAGWSALDFGVSAATVKLVAEDRARGDAKSAGQVILASLAFYGLLGLAGSLAIWFAAPALVALFKTSAALHADAVLAFRLAALRFALFFVAQVFVSVFKGLYRFEYSTLLVSLLSIATYGGAAAGVLVAGAGLVGISWIALAANLALLLFAAPLAAHHCRRYGIRVLGARPQLSTFRRIFSFGAFIGANYLAYALVTQIGPMVLSSFLGPAAVAVFNIASSVTLRAQAAFNALYEFVLPMTAARVQTLDDEGRWELRRIYLKALRIGAVLSVAGFGALYGFAPEIARLWLPSEIEAPVGEILRLLSIGAAASSLTPLAYHFINGLGRPATNTLFLVALAAIAYGTLALLSLSGMTVRGFAVAQSTGFFCYGAGLLVFGEAVVWRQWVPRLARALRAGAP